MNHDGAALVTQLSWFLYLSGAFLVVTGIKMWVIADPMPDIANNPLLRFLRKYMRVTNEVQVHSFVVRQPDPGTSKMALAKT